MPKPIISIIVAVDRNCGIGLRNNLLAHLPPDLKHFKELTTGHTVIMGQRTYESIGRPLPNRENIILSDKTDFQVEGARVFNNLEAALDFAKKNEKEEVFFMGGASVYRQAMPLADKLYLTLIDAQFPADTFFPHYSQFDKVISESDWQEHNGVRFKFLELTK